MKRTVTLIELVVVIVLAGIITVGLASFIIQVIKTYQFVEFRNEVAQEGKKALDWMVRDIKEIKDNDSILVADVSHIQFINSDDETIDYILDGNTIERNSYALCDYVESLVFEYRDKNNNVLSPLPLSSGKRRQIKSIKVTIDLKKQNQQIDFFSVVFPRSL